MPKPGPAAEGHRRNHLKDMSALVEDDGWQPPPPDECNFANPDTYPISLTADGKDEVRVRLVTHERTSRMAEFALIQRTFYRGKWRLVAEVDSSHPGEVHAHRHARSTGGRVGQPEPLKEVQSQADLEDGYELAYAYIVNDWERNKQRWHDG